MSISDINSLGQPRTDGDVENCAGLLEIKYFASSVDLPLATVAAKSASCLKIVDDKLTLKETHPYYDQVQLQLAVTGMYSHNIYNYAHYSI
jgi:hypothetical protein